MSMRANERAAALLALHEGPGFVIPNAWDGGSARILEQAGFPAIATTSAGIAWSLGVRDGEAVDRDTMLEHVSRIVGAVGVPVSADLEAGYAATADGVAETVALAAGLGVAGCNLEDIAGGVLFEFDEAAERIAAARTAAPAGSFVINARTDTYFSGALADPFDATIERATAYLAAGADCVFVPGVADEATIARLAEAIPGPLNIVAGLAASTPAPRFFELGVRRVSLGGSIARAAYGAVANAAAELQETGTLGFLDGVPSYAAMQARYSDRPTA